MFPKCKFLLLILVFFGRMAISRAEFCFFLIAMCIRNRTMGIPALEDSLSVKLLFFIFLHIENGGAGYCNVDHES